MARILIVDPEKHIRELFSLELSEQGHEIVSAASYRNLVKKIEISKVDLVVLDVKSLNPERMEILDEIHVCYSDLPVIIWTAHDFRNSQRKRIAAEYYVFKSYDLTELKSRIQRALDARDAFPDRAVV